MISINSPFLDDFLLHKSPSFWGISHGHGHLHFSVILRYFSHEKILLRSLSTSAGTPGHGLARETDPDTDRLQLMNNSLESHGLPVASNGI